jgi:predicted transcriptional regulator
MTRFKKKMVKARLLRMAAMKSTGSPSDAAKKLDISERSVKRFIGELRREGQPIRFSYTIRSYVIMRDFPD